MCFIYISYFIVLNNNILGITLISINILPDIFELPKTNFNVFWLFFQGLTTYKNVDTMNNFGIHTYKAKLDFVTSEF